MQLLLDLLSLSVGGLWGWFMVGLSRPLLARARKADPAVSPAAALGLTAFYLGVGVVGAAVLAVCVARPLVDPGWGSGVWPLVAGFLGACGAIAGILLRLVLEWRGERREPPN